MRKIFLGLILVFSFSKAVDSTFYATNPDSCTLSYPLCSYAKQVGLVYREFLKIEEMMLSKKINEGQKDILTKEAIRNFLSNVCLDFRVMSEQELVMLGDMEFYFREKEPFKMTEEQLMDDCMDFW